MIDLPPSAASSQAIEQRLAGCGLEPGAVSVQRQEGLQGVEVVIRRRSQASEASIPCVYEAASKAIVQFEDSTLQQAYDHYVSEALRPQLLVDAKKEVARLGLLERFPRRAGYGDLSAYTRALEQHCGVRPGSVLAVSDGLITFAPSVAIDSENHWYERIFAAITYAAALGDIESIGFIGNEEAR